MKSAVIGRTATSFASLVEAEILTWGKDLCLYSCWGIEFLEHPLDPSSCSFLQRARLMGPQIPCHNL
jgi:hypothetical protein